MVATCRSSYDLTQHLCSRLASESPSNEAKVETLTKQTTSLRDEFQQLEMLAKTKERSLRDERYATSFYKRSHVECMRDYLGIPKRFLSFPLNCIFVAYLSMACAKSLT